MYICAVLVICLTNDALLMNNDVCNSLNNNYFEIAYSVPLFISCIAIMFPKLYDQM